MSTDSSSTLPAAIPAPPRRTPVAVWVHVAALAGVALATGEWMIRGGGEGTVDVIRVWRHSMLPESLVGTPDYYVVVRVTDKAKEPITLEGYSDTPIGNGLDFKLPKPLPLEEIATVELFDEDVASDERDRVDVRGRVNRGLEYEFDLTGPPPKTRTAAYVALGAGGALLATAAILLIRSHAL